jgi:hypothetical protein
MLSLPREMQNHREKVILVTLRTGLNAASPESRHTIRQRQVRALFTTDRRIRAPALGFLPIRLMSATDDPVLGM